MNCQTIRECAPIHLTALERFKDLKEWIKSWMPKEVLFLEPKHWFVEGHDLRYDGINNEPKIISGSYVWTPPPAMTDVAIEQLRCAVLKRQ